MSETAVPRPAARARSIVFCALSIALITVSAWVTVPIGPIPFTLQTLSMTFVLFALTPKEAIASIAGYLVLGAIGLPMFSSFKGGLAALLGPTGGFLIGFLVAAVVAVLLSMLLRRLSYFSEPKQVTARRSTPLFVLHMVMGVVFLVVAYGFGWAWLSLTANMPAEAAFAAAVAPFVPFDLIKMVLAALMAQAVSRAIVVSGAR